MTVMKITTIPIVIPPSTDGRVRMTSTARAFELEQSAYHRWCRNRSAVNWDSFCQARGTANRLYAAAKARYSAN